MALKLSRLGTALQSAAYGFKAWADKICTQLETAINDQQSQLDTINAILDDNTLTPDKKPVWIFMYSFLTGEQSSLDSEATTYGITTEKTAYDNAVSALTTYLGTLTTPVAWNDVSGNTAITGTTLRSKFNDVLVKKQALLNKMHDTARSLANTAQSTATTANSNASTALTNAATAQSTANTANTNATAAQSTANTVKLNDKISGSWTVPGTILTGHDTGTDVTVTVASHDRHYGDNSVTTGVSGTTFTGLAYSWDYYIYYDDTTTSDTTPTYQITHAAAQAMPNKAAGRHFCGKITTPASGAADTSGGGGFSAGQITRVELT